MLVSVIYKTSTKPGIAYPKKQCLYFSTFFATFFFDDGKYDRLGWNSLVCYSLTPTDYPHKHIWY